MNIIEILMERDEVSREEAINLIVQTREEMFVSGDDGILMDNLGLELDYLIDVLMFGE